MADIPWPSVEAALIDHLPTVTPIDWEAPGRSEPGARVPLGVVEQVGGIQDVGLDKQATVEVTVYAARRPGCWQLASAIDIAMLRGLNPGAAGGVFIDETQQAFGWVIDPDRAGDGYMVATATYTLTVRPQVEAMTEGETNGY